MLRSLYSLESIMKKFSIVAAAAALAMSAAAPVAADSAKADPFVATQGAIGPGAALGIAAGAAVIIAVAANDDT